MTPGLPSDKLPSLAREVAVRELPKMTPQSRLIRSHNELQPSYRGCPQSCLTSYQERTGLPSMTQACPSSADCFSLVRLGVIACVTGGPYQYSPVEILWAAVPPANRTLLLKSVRRHHNTAIARALGDGQKISPVECGQFQIGVLGLPGMTPGLPLQ